MLRQTGGEGPWATVSVSAAVPLTRPLAAGYQVKRKVSVVSQRQKGVLTRGDVLKVTILIDASDERYSVVVCDPNPAGATIAGDISGQRRLHAEHCCDGPGIERLPPLGLQQMLDN